MSRAEELAAALEEANEALVSFALSCAEEQWATVVPGENWPVGVVVHHCALGHLLLVRWVETARRCVDIDDTSEGIDAVNAVHATDSARVELADTVELLRANAAHAAAVLRALSDEEFDRSVGFGPAGGKPFTVEHLAGTGPAHCRSHLASVLAALR